MRNYIILNDQNSNDISGLLIQSLAPISKPLMRTEIEEIDGRDGDITTKLGYSAYDKQITIGLFGNYDVDQVIAFFNSEGTAIFSNEPDKYYNYQIVDQIDFERLVRYKTATVTMHCQPFKYSTTEGADILSSSDNFATLNQSLNTDSGFYTYSSNVQADVTATRQSGTGGKFFAVFTVPVVQGVNYHFSGNVSRNVSMYGYTDQLRGTSAGIAGKGFSGNFVYTATFTGTMVLGFYSSATTEIFIRNFAISNEAGATISAEGTNLVLEGTGEAPFSQFDLKGNTEQQTYTGKNLLSLIGRSDGGITGTITNGSTVTITGTASGSDGYSIANNVSPNLPAGTYTLTIDKPSTHVINLTASTSGGNVAFRLAAGQTTITKTLTSAATAVQLFWAVTSGTTYNETFTFQLVAGSTADYDFEPYVGGVASPNPDYPQAVKVVTGNNTIKICGKNLVKPIASSTTTNGVTFTANDDGTYTANGTATAAINFYLMGSTWIDAKAGTYTASDGVQSGESNTTFFTFVDGANGYRIENESTTFTLASDTNIRMRFVVRSGATLNNVTFKPMIEKTSQATSYEPYQEQSYPISLGTLELCKLGNQQDYVYKSGDKWYKHQVIGKSILDGSESWVNASTSGYAYFRADLDSFAAPEGLCYCDKFTRRTGGHGEYECIWIQGNSGTLYLQISDSRLSAHSLAAFKTWLSENTPVVYYVLVTPVEEEITNAALIEQLNDIADHAHAYKERTHISSTYADGNMPHIIAAAVTGDASGTVTNSGNIYSKPKLTIFGTGDIGVYLNGVQMFQIALGTSGYITIDTALMEAYQDNLQTLMNRQVTGDYSNFVLNPGENTISFTGSVSMCVVENYSRWL